MTISLSYPHIKKLSEVVGFEIKSTAVVEGDLRLYGDSDDYAEASLYIDFISKSIYVTIYSLGTDYLDEEKKVRLDF